MRCSHTVTTMAMAMILLNITICHFVCVHTGALMLWQHKGRHFNKMDIILPRVLVYFEKLWGYPIPNMLTHTSITVDCSLFSTAIAMLGEWQIGNWEASLGKYFSSIVTDGWGFPSKQPSGPMQNIVMQPMESSFSWFHLHLHVDCTVCMWQSMEQASALGYGMAEMTIIQ